VSFDEWLSEVLQFNTKRQDRKELAQSFWCVGFGLVGSGQGRGGSMTSDHTTRVFHCQDIPDRERLRPDDLLLFTMS
jgi:hypothetical protein